MQRDGGFTLIELLIGISVFTVLLLLAGPQYAEFMGNSQIRNGSENTLAGVRKAQAEAVRGNTRTQFVLDTTPCSGGWVVNRLNDDGNFDQVDSYTFADGACKTTVSAEPTSATMVTFSGLGRVIQNADESPTIRWVQVTNTNISSPRYLRVVISPQTPTGIKLCDPNPIVDAADPRYCPAT